VVVLKRALLIGCNYPGTGFDLAGCVNDALDWQLALLSHDYSTVVMTDEECTRANILAALKNLLLDSDEGDTALVQYSGHGSYVPDEDGDEPDGVDECWIPFDVRTRGVITDDELHALFQTRPARVPLVMISDSCHSGTVSRMATAQRSATSIRFLPPSAFLPRAELAKLQGLRSWTRGQAPGRRATTLLLGGCQDSQYSYDAWFDDRPNGAFSRVAIDTLKKVPKNASYTTWFAEIAKRLPSQSYPQSPSLWGTKTARRRRALT